MAALEGDSILERIILTEADILTVYLGSVLQE
jgi:hypothetical protein